LGWSSSARSPTPTPADTKTIEPLPSPAMSAGEPLTGSAPSPGWTPGPQAGYTRRRRRRARGIVVPLVVIGLVALAIGGATTALNAGSNALDGFTASIDQATRTTTTRNTPSSGTSLIRPAALKAALDKLPAGDVQLLRLAPDRINANVVVDGKLHVVQVSAGGDVDDVVTPASGGGTDTLKAVNSVAPSRIVRTATRRTGRRPSSVSYLVLIHILGKDQWQLYFDDGVHFSASANGKKVHRVG